MNLSSPFVRRPIGTVLLTIGIALAGIGAFFVLPVAPLPQVDYPVISVSANIPGASPETMATSVATPLERHLGTIAGVNEMTSQSSTGSSRVTLQFDLNRNIDGAAREVQAAISASRVDLPATLRSNPTYKKANPAASPVIILALTSKTKTPGQIYEAVSNIVSQRLSQVEGVGDVEIGGGSLPAVRIELLPFALNRYGISTEDVRAAVQASNANRPKGIVQDGLRRLQIYTQTPALKASDYAPMVVAWRRSTTTGAGAAVRLQDVAQVVDGVEDTHTLGLFNGQPAIVILITRQPSANVIETVDSVRALLPELRAELPPDVELNVANDSTNSIRGSLREVELTLVISVVLVVLVVSAFLRSWRATVVPAVATVVALLGTFGVMYLLGFSLNNLSLMALTVATGFVVDDAIVVLENTSRHIEAGMSRLNAALLGAREVGFTVLSISLSLVAVFIPLLFMGGQTGRLFREFAVTLSAAVLISLVISLTTTPMMCAWLLEPGGEAKKPGRIARAAERAHSFLLRRYEASLDWALASKALVMAILVAVVGLNVYLFMKVPKGFFPQQDSGQLGAGLRADQSISSEEMGRKLRRVVDIVHADPAVDTVVGFTGGGRAGGGFMFVNLKPRGKAAGQRQEGGLAVIARLRPQLARITGLQVFLGPTQDVRSGGRQSNSTYQYTLKSDNLADLKTWAAKLADALRGAEALTDVDTDQQENGVETMVNVDRASAGRLGLTSSAIDAALYDAFGQRQVATIYTELNQYHVVMEWAPGYTRSPNALADVYVPGTSTVNNGGQVVTTETVASTTSGTSTASATGSTNGAAATTGTSGTTPIPVSANPGLKNASTGNVLANTPARLVPLSTVSRTVEQSAATSVNHQDGELATTVSFNLAEGRVLGDAQAAIAKAEADIGMPTNVRGSFAGTAASAQQSQGQQTLLIVAAIVVIYLVLGILYESLVHPLTVLSTLPSAGVGAVLALMLFDMEFSIIALIGVFLLIGIVKKNAILIIDFALEAERGRGLDPVAAVREACLLRFRPILMTTLAAALGALPLAIGFGEGAELRQPLGVAIIGGLVASQLLTLLTTPVVYLLLDKLRRRGADERHLSHAADPIPEFPMTRLPPAAGLALSMLLLLGACTVGPAYQRPEAAAPARFKEAPSEAGADWLPAAPADALDRGEWWQGFGDPVLDGLLRQVEVSNQNVAAAVANHDQARALVRQQRAALLPQLSAAATGRRDGGNGAAATGDSFQASLDASWQADVWGGLRQAVTGAQASAEASEADLANARLSAQAELADDYFLLRDDDTEIDLLESTVVAYARSLKITQNRYAAAIAAQTDVLQAQTQLASAQADLANLRGQRAQLEHAIAVLAGQPPGDFAIAKAAWRPTVPPVPLAVPSALLQRRPDIASAERAVAAANAQVGVQQSAWFPSVSLSGSFGHGGSRVGDLFNASTTLWTLGLSVAQTVFDAGATTARVDEARAARDAAAARYRQTVLAAFQGVEDQLSTARALAEQEGLRREASRAADLTEQQLLNRYTAGLVGYTDVVTAQASALNARRTLAQVAANRQVAAVTLIQALGGGWSGFGAYGP